MVDTKDGEVGMTKQEILDQFRDINLAYNDCTKLDTLSAMLDELLEAAQHWISVKDRLPESAPNEYLVVNGGKVQLATFIDGMWITPHRVSSITHWMPMPEPPKEET